MDQRRSSMAQGVNKVILVGNLGRDPEIRYMPNGTAVANITIVTSDSWNDKKTGKQYERTEWHRVVFFKRLAEIVCEYLKKGSNIYVEGRLQTRKWQDQSGQDRYTTEIVANNMQMLGGAAPYAMPTESVQTTSPKKSSPVAALDDFNDDIPF